MDASPAITVQIEGPRATVWLDRAEKRNAFDDAMAAELAAAFRDLHAQEDVRAIVLAGRGKSFCAGGDLAWMKRVADYAPEENLEDARAFQDAYEAIDHCPKPVIGRVQGHALGGGAGLLAVCDIVVAVADVRVGFPEVHLGLVPGVISPYVIRRIGAGHARRYFLTGEVFDGRTAWGLGLVNELVEAEDQLDTVVDGFVDAFLRVSPEGVTRAKRLVHELDAMEGEKALRVARKAIADARGSADGKEGTAAFLEKRKARWQT